MQSPGMQRSEAEHWQSTGRGDATARTGADDMELLFTSARQPACFNDAKQGLDKSPSGHSADPYSHESVAEDASGP